MPGWEVTARFLWAGQGQAALPDPGAEPAEGHTQLKGLRRQEPQAGEEGGKLGCGRACRLRLLRSSSCRAARPLCPSGLSWAICGCCQPAAGECPRRLLDGRGHTLQLVVGHVQVVVAQAAEEPLVQVSAPQPAGPQRSTLLCPGQLQGWEAVVAEVQQQQGGQAQWGSVSATHYLAA